MLDIPAQRSTPRPVWSVMIPTYNCAEYLRDTLLSVLNQAYEPELMQIEVVDDASADDPATVVDEIGRGRVSFFRQRANVGHVENFNTCIYRARGEIVHLLHGDDMVRPGFYDRMQRAFVSSPSPGAAFCRSIFVDAYGQPLGKSQPLLHSSGLIEDAAAVLATRTPIYTPAMIVKREVYENLGGFDPRFQCCGEDLEMWIRIASRYPVWYEPETFAVYRRLLDGESGGLTGRGLRTGANIRDVSLAIDIYKDYLPAARAKSIVKSAQQRTALWGLSHAERLLAAGDGPAARSQIREAVRCRRSTTVFRKLTKVLYRTMRRQGLRALWTLLKK
jgi:glycosyltransferase involved in cell wall biosynthesis